MKYEYEILEVIKDHTQDTDFTNEEQIEFTQELMLEFFDRKVSLEVAKEIYTQSLSI